MNFPSKTTRLLLAAVSAACGFSLTAPASGINLTFVKNFGGPGSGSGQFNLPYGLAVDGAHNVYVADLNNGRIDRFNTGSFADTFMAFGGGNFTRPNSVALDAAGNIYFADGQYRVGRFSAATFPIGLSYYGAVSTIPSTTQGV